MISLSLAYAQDATSGAPAGAPPVTASSLPARYPAGSIQSLEAADRALEEVNQARTHIEAQFVQDEQACYPKFFTTSCLQEAKERRRHDLAQIRPIEIDANAFKRRDRLAQRDKALADKMKQEEAEAPQRERERQEKEAERLEKSASKASEAQAREDAAEARRAGFVKRAAEREQKLKQREAREAAEAQKRTENTAAYEQKVRDAEARQREVAAGKAGK